VKERTAELEEAKKRNELILHSVGEGICGIDPDGKITFVNPRAAQLIGWDPNDLIGRNAHATFHHTRPDGCPYPVEECPVHSALNNGNGEYEANGEFLRKDGTRFPVEFMTTPLTEGGSIIGAVMVFSDITERKRAEEDLRKLTEDLKRSNSDLQQFAYIASHDLQSPLRNIEGFVKMLARKYKGQLDGKADEYIRYISEGVKDMQTLIHDLLEFSKVDRGGKVFTKVDTSLCIAKALSNQSRAIIEKNAEVNLDEPFPAVFGDSVQLTSLFQNLIGNAIKFCRERPVIYISVKKEDKEYVFLVRDNGIGINPENSDKIFAIFHRLHSKSEYPGTGIGLAICSKIIERHKGRIWVESEPGKGSAFKFTFPIPE